MPSLRSPWFVSLVVPFLAAGAGCAGREPAPLAGAGVPLRGQISDAEIYTVETTAVGTTKVSRQLPFQMANAWGVPQVGNRGAIVVSVFERPVAEEQACTGPSGYVGRVVTVHLQWPLPPGSTHSTTAGTPMRPAIFVGAKSEKGSGGNRWEGDVRVVEANANGGLFWLQAADKWFEGIRFRGHVDGDVRFAICSR